MAQSILPYSTLAKSHYPSEKKYELPEADRQKILAGSDSARQARFIEKQRQNFIQKNGHDGGVFS